MTVDRQLEWLELCKGLRSHQVAGILNRHDSEAKWTRRNKTEMAEVWVAIHNGNAGRVTDPEALRRELEGAPRKTRADVRKAKADREKAKRLNDFKDLMYATLEDGGDTDDIAVALFKAEPSATDIEQLHNLWIAEKDQLENQIIALRRELCRIVHLDMVTTRALAVSSAAGPSD